MIYLDYHASHPMLPCVQQTMIQAVRLYGNPSSVHGYGQGIRRKIEDVRENIARNVGLDDARIIFTSGATEANTLALNGQYIFAGKHEHPATLQQIPAENHIAVTGEGMLDLEDLEQALQTLSPEIKPLVSLMLANNETGVIQPIKEAAQLVHRHCGLLHVDAVQAVARVKIDMRSMGIDLLSLSAHKMGGPPGVGALVMTEALTAEPVILGGGQERGQRGGTENWLGIIGWGAAWEWYEEHHKELRAHLRKLDEYLYRLIADSKTIVWQSKDQKRVMGNALLLCAEKDAQSLLIQLDLAGIAVSSGSACSSGRVGKSHVLEAMGICSEIAGSAIRVSYGLETTEQDIAAFVACYRKAVRA